MVSAFLTQTVVGSTVEVPDTTGKEEKKVPPIYFDILGATSRPVAVLGVCRFIRSCRYEELDRLGPSM